MAHLSISLLGPLRTTLDGQPIGGFGYHKVRALLVYLAVEAGRPHDRETLVGLLWPDLPEAAARTNLRQALATLREAIGDETAAPPFLLTTRTTVQFNPDSDFDLDVSAFGALLDRCHAHAHRGLDRCPACAARMEQAAALYQGAFLAQFSLADSVPFEEWAVLKREQLHRRAQAMLAGLAGFHERRGAYDEAQRCARRQIELDPWHEAAYVQLMRALARSGQRSAALAAYESCRRALAEGLGAPPSTETRTLYEQIMDGRHAASPAQAGALLNWPAGLRP